MSTLRFAPPSMTTLIRTPAQVRALRTTDAQCREMWKLQVESRLFDGASSGFKEKDGFLYKKLEIYSFDTSLGQLIATWSPCMRDAYPGWICRAEQEGSVLHVRLDEVQPVADSM